MIPVVLRPRSHLIAAHPVRLAVHDWGGSGNPVLLAHPTGFHGRSWAPVAELLVAAGRRVYSFDFRGHGDSDPAPKGHYDWEGFADDVLAVTAELGLIANPHLLAVGHSKGGAALILAEARRRGTYAQLWCYEPIIFPSDEPLPPQDDFPLAEGARRRRDQWDSVDEAIDAYESKPPLNVLRADALRAYVQYGLRQRADGKYELKCKPEHEASVYSMGMAHGAYQRLADVTVPTHVACGEHTDAIVPKIAQKIVDRLPKGELEVMPGLGHFGPMQDPDAIAASILTFAAD